MLPRLCYIGPQIGPALGGPALLYKLFSHYPPERLLIVQVQAGKPSGEVNSTGFRAVRVPSPPGFGGPRARTLYELSFLLGRYVWAAWVQRRIRLFRCEAVVSVIHGWICEVGLQVARLHGVPFHAILHDHAEATLPVPRFMGTYRMKRWRRLCSQATSRLCISPFMAEEVSQLTGRRCHLLYPGLAPEMDLTNWQAPPPKRAEGGLTFAFAGFIHPGYITLLHRLAKQLASGGHRLVLHSPHAEALISDANWRGAVDGGWIPTSAVAETLCREADVLVLPMSFAPHDQSNMRVSFPSKIAEYCAAGRPVLVWGPSYCSAVRWAKDHAGFAEVVDTDSDERMRAAVEKLSESQDRRVKMGMESLRLAREFFSHEKTFASFQSVLCQGANSREALRVAK